MDVDKPLVDIAVVQVKSLEEVCFTQILWTLEEHTVDRLGLLPKKIRHRMLHELPVVDICQLDGTQFTSGLDMNTVWEKVYKDRISSLVWQSHRVRQCQTINPHYCSSQQTWRECFLSTVYSTILKDDRPYGYFQVWDNSRPRVGSDITEDRPVCEHPVDIVNYLVAMKCKKNPKDEKKPLKDTFLYGRGKYGTLHIVMKRHEVTLVKGIVPPGIKYHQACKSKQLIPPRYSKFLSEGSCFLPDSTAIELINKECEFSPREVNIFVSEFSTFLQNAQYERSNLDFLSDFFKEVESLTVHGEVERSMNWRDIHGAKAITSSEEIPARVLRLILSNTTSNLAHLNINVTKTKDDVIPSITPVLTSFYNGLKEISIHAKGKVSPDLVKLISITEHQSILHTISISINKIIQSTSPCAPSKYGIITPQVSFSLLCSWIQICFKKPSFYHLKLSLSPVSAEVLMQILIIFLSTPCSHDQTLTLSYMQLYFMEDIKSSKSEYHSTSRTSFPYGSGESLPLQMKPSKSKPPSNSNCNISTLLLHRFDDAHTLRYKSLIFDNCNIKPSFIASVFGLQLKLKQLVIDDYHSSVFSALIQQPGFDIQSLRISSMSMHGITFNDYSSLLQKQSLRNVRFINCSSVDTKAIHDAATLRGFHLEESHFDKTHATPRPRETVTYTFTRK